MGPPVPRSQEKVLLLPCLITLGSQTSTSGAGKEAKAIGWTWASRGIQAAQQLHSMGGLGHWPCTVGGCLGEII